MRNENINEILPEELPNLFRYFYNRLKNKSFRGSRWDSAHELAQLTAIDLYRNSLKESLLKHSIPALLNVKRQNIFAEFFDVPKKSLIYVGLENAASAIVRSPGSRTRRVREKPLQIALAMLQWQAQKFQDII